MLDEGKIEVFSSLFANDFLVTYKSKKNETKRIC